MLQFNQLRVTPDGKYLVIDASVQEQSYYDNVCISSVIVDTQDTYDTTGPSSKPLFQFDYDDAKHITEYIDLETVQDNLFFVYVIAVGEPTQDTPCGMKQSSIMGVAYNKCALYKKGSQYLASLQGCDIPRDFIDYILREKAFELSLSTCNYTTAIDYWNKFLSKNKSNYKKRCGCRGKS